MNKFAFSARQHWKLWEDAARSLSLADRYCSSPFWGIPLVQAFHRKGNLAVYEDDGELAVFHEIDVEGGRLILPCDTMWMLGSPILASNPGVFLERLCDYWRNEGGPLRQVTISGCYLDNQIWSSSIWLRLSNWASPGSARQVASLKGGCDGFLSRRSPNFRSRLKRAVKKAVASGVEVELWPEAASKELVFKLLGRAMAVEKLSWKGLAGQGVDRGQMREFYELMLPILAKRGLLRGLFLKRDGRDLSYLFGAFFGEGFRGLQFSFIETEHNSLGNVSQWKMIEHLCAQGCRTYDLGQAMSYKSRWAENKIVSRTLSFQID